MVKIKFKSEKVEFPHSKFRKAVISKYFFLFRSRPGAIYKPCGRPRGEGGLFVHMGGGSKNFKIPICTLNFFLNKGEGGSLEIHMDREGGSQNVHACPQGGRGGQKTPKICPHGL